MSRVLLFHYISVYDIVFDGYFEIFRSKEKVKYKETYIDRMCVVFAVVSES